LFVLFCLVNGGVGEIQEARSRTLVLLLFFL